MHFIFMKVLFIRIKRRLYQLYMLDLKSKFVRKQALDPVVIRRALTF